MGLAERNNIIGLAIVQNISGAGGAKQYHRPCTSSIGAGGAPQYTYLKYTYLLCSYLKGHVQVYFYAATWSRTKHMHLVPRPPGRARGVRPTDIARFAEVWHGFVRVRRKA